MICDSLDLGQVLQELDMLSIRWSIKKPHFVAMFFVEHVNCCTLDSFVIKVQ